MSGLHAAWRNQTDDAHTPRARAIGLSDPCRCQRAVLLGDRPTVVVIHQGSSRLNADLDVVGHSWCS